MSTFLQLHLLTAYAPANLNRDDTGRPKTARMGGFDRLRVSSQSLKRAWRTSSVFFDELDKQIGIRTRRIGLDFVYEPMLAAGIADKLAWSAAEKIASRFGKLKADKNPKDKRDNLHIEQLVHISNYEKTLIEQLVATLIAEKREPFDEELDLLRKQQRSVDIALFGRMLASKPDFNVEAACQVAHALGVGAVTVEDDFFTAVDDLNRGEETGSAHMGEQGFASALFYSYICVSRDLLLENLGGDEALTKRTLAALTTAAMTVSPSGKQNSFASRAYASYALAEWGNQQPRSLAVAFFQPVRDDDQLPSAIKRLERQCAKFDAAYGECAAQRYVLNVEGESSLLEGAEAGSLAGLLDFVRR